ncbi:unnamed protein product [marine sediment metagenome]|uniref:Uncharacterized protein n=1 Tax=marine sediment metagenome TaxID=412755 RepID=X1LM56_9ZZZZ
MKTIANWAPDRVAAIILVVGCLILVGFGIDGELKAILAMAAVWLFRGVYIDRKK